MDFSEQMTVIRESLRAKRMAKDNRVRFVSPEKWRAIMIRCLERFKTKKLFDSNMIEDLLTIIDKIPEGMFVEATLNIQPFKPSFISQARMEERTRRSNANNIEEEDHPPSPLLRHKQTITKFKHSVHEKLNHSDVEAKSQIYKKSLLEEILTLVTEETTLTKQFQAKYHPYRKVIEQFLFLLENKYKLIIDSRQSVEVQQIQEKLITDLSLLQEFIVKSSEPYLAIFKSQNSEEKEMFQFKLIAFIRQYVEKNQKINISIRKIMRAACRKTTLIKLLIAKVPEFAEINDFDVPDNQKIDGGYVYSMTTLMEFAETTTSLVALQKLRQFRRCMSEDLQQFYKGQKAPSQLQMTADTQLQIIKFIVVKVKSFVCEIYAQLKYLQVVCGEQDMSYRFDDSSYMYAQLSVIFQALELDYNKDLQS